MQRTLITTLLCCFAVVFSSCMKETGETILLPVKGSKIPLSVLTEEMQAELADHMPIHEGDTPPDISGTYQTSPMCLIYASDGYSNEFYDMRWQVDAIDWWNSTTYFEWQNTASGSAIEAHLIGTGDSFTLYTIDHVVNDTDGWSCELITVVSGKKVAGGIANYRYAIVMRNKRDENGLLMEPDYYRVFADGDGLASQI